MIRVGVEHNFNDTGGKLDDHVIWADEMALALLDEPLGFDSIWATEHHFEDYGIIPDNIQFLTYMAGCTNKVQLGTCAIVLPWHDPVRVIERMAILDHLSNGRAIFGIARGLARVEFEKMRIPRDESRQRYSEIADMIVSSWETGVINYDGEIFKIDNVRLRPRPTHPLNGRLFSGAISKETQTHALKLGLGVLVAAQKPYERHAQDVIQHRTGFIEQYGKEPPRPSVHCVVYVDEDTGRLRDMGPKYIRAMYQNTLDHYEVANAPSFKNVKGYEYYEKMADSLTERGADAAMDFFLDISVCGTPDQAIDKIRYIVETLGSDHFVLIPRYGGMSGKEAERNLRCFAEKVLPKVRKFDVAKLPDA